MGDFIAKLESDNSFFAGYMNWICIVSKGIGYKKLNLPTKIRSIVIDSEFNWFLMLSDEALAIYVMQFPLRITIMLLQKFAQQYKRKNIKRWYIRENTIKSTKILL